MLYTPGDPHAICVCPAQVHELLAQLALEGARNAELRQREQALEGALQLQDRVAAQLPGPEPGCAQQQTALAALGGSDADACGSGQSGGGPIAAPDAAASGAASGSNGCAAGSTPGSNAARQEQQVAESTPPLNACQSDVALAANLQALEQVAVFSPLQVRVRACSMRVWTKGWALPLHPAGLPSCKPSQEFGG